MAHYRNTLNNTRDRLPAVKALARKRALAAIAAVEAKTKEVSPVIPRAGGASAGGDLLPSPANSCPTCQGDGYINTHANLPDTPCPACRQPIKKPKRVTSWRTCPACGGRATKLLHLNTGVYTCQQCDHKYTWEPTTKKLASTRTVRDWFWK